MFRVASSLMFVCDYLLIMVVGRGTALLAGRSRVWYPTGSIGIFRWFTSFMSQLSGNSGNLNLLEP